MNLKTYQPIFELLLISTLLYLGHKLFFVFKIINSGNRNFYYPLETIYGFFVSCSFVILFILIQVRKKNIDNVGYVFLALTCIKMAISYGVLAPILKSAQQHASIEKINFFILFFLFLAIETIVTIRILNKK